MSLDHPTYLPPLSVPSCPEWCYSSDYPGLADFLLYHGSPLDYSWPTTPSLTVLSPFSLDYEVPPDSIVWRDFSPTSSQSSSPETSTLWVMHPTSLPPKPALQFAPKLLRIFESSEVPQDAFHCVICEAPSSLTRTSPPKSKCCHYVSCSECQSRIVRQLLRCGSCSRELTGEYPVCSPECECVTKSLSQMLQTTQCPRCGDKLAKETCGSTCTRKKSPAYKSCVQRLTREVAAMVIVPDICMKYFPGSRPCCHYSRCELHGKIMRGRSHRCSECREVSRSGPSVGVKPTELYKIDSY